MIWVVLRLFYSPGNNLLYSRKSVKELLHLSLNYKGVSYRCTIFKVNFQCVTQLFNFRNQEFKSSVCVSFTVQHFERDKSHLAI